VLLISSALVLGFLHGLGADHLMAIAALSLTAGAEPPATQRTRAIGVAMRFAAGHAVLLGGGAAVLIVLGWSLPLVLERSGEILGGLLLVIIGGVGLWGVAGGRVYGHSHVHGRESTPHFHLHIGRPERHPRPSAHSHLPTIVGAAFAVNSLRALTMLAPFGLHVEAISLPTLLALVVVFALGILLSMSLFGIAFARVISARGVRRLGRFTAGGIAIASIALGIFWMVQA
jgi:nickel/cobalt transporter (NicO) family protein